MCRLIKGCLQLNAAPDLGWPLDMNPADYVAQVICELSLVQGNAGRIFHICHPRMMKLESYFQWLRKSFGYTTLRLIGYEQWREALVQEIAALSEGGVAVDQVRFILSCAHTLRAHTPCVRGEERSDGHVRLPLSSSVAMRCEVLLLLLSSLSPLD